MGDHWHRRLIEGKAATFAVLTTLTISIGGLVIGAMYFLGFGVALLTASALKRTILPSPPPALLLELPPYRLPLARPVGRQVLGRCNPRRRPGK